MSGAVKGHPIRIIAGTYKGKQGWINEGKKNSSDTTVPVLVQVKKGEIKATYIHFTSFEFKKDTIPISYAEAVMKQCPKIESSMVSLCRQLAQCEIEKDLPGMTKLFQRMLKDAVAYQENKGSEARYRRIKYKDKSGKMME